MGSPALGSPAIPAPTTVPSTRRLAAVWIADIVGYTRLSAQDENAALQIVEIFQRVVKQEVERYGGRLVKFLGDGALAEFPSTDAAVRSALTLRQAFQSEALAGDEQGLIRVAVHVGQIVSASDGDIYGDGVNMTFRLEKEAEPGQVLVSEDVWRHLHQQRDFVFRVAGDRALRGITGRVRLFEVGLEQSAPAARAPVDRRSIAVLPFLDISPGHDNEYFSDGMSEELINALSHVQGLHVASRTSSFSFRGKDVTVREIADRLGVATVLEGSVRKDGNRVRITPQLIDAENGYHIWSELYVSDMADVFEVQEKISRAIVDALQVKLAGPGDAPVVRRPTSDLDAYNLYLRGRYHWNRHSGDDLKKSIEYYEAAIAIDPDYALAHAGIADTFLTLGALFLPPTDAYPRARAAAHRALELDPDLAEAHAALAEVRMRFEWDWEAAERGFRRALELDPNYGEGSRMFANYLRDMGRIDEAIVEIRRAQALDPPSLPISAAVAGIYYFARRYDEAIEEAQRVLAEAPYFFQALFYLGFSYERKAMYDEAIETFERMVELSGIPSAVAALGHAHATAGHRDQAEASLAGLLQRSKTQYVTPYSIARLYTALGDLDKAFTWFDRACLERSNWLTSLLVEPALDPLRADPRFAALLERIGLIEETQAAPENLPSSPTPLVGRGREIGEVRARLLDGQSRLLTLTGPGGTGKTRLALEVARKATGDFPDGIFFIPLATVTDPGLVPAAIARTLSLSESGTETPLEILTSHLPGKKLLLILDSFERVLDAAPAVSTILESTTNTKVLVTSREPLHLRGEQEYLVGPLTLPDPKASEDPQRILGYEAVGLFVQRAQAVKPAFRLTPENARHVVEICGRLDGLPLAIELAAARAKLMSPEIMLERLTDRFAFLTAGPRDVPKHQRTLRGAFDWSYDLLTEQEQTLFRRLAVFVGGFTMEAAEAVARPAGEREFHVFDLVASLVDKSLLREMESPDATPRFEMLETTREYGSLLLHESGEIGRVRRRHADYFLDLAQRAEPKLDGPDQALWFDRLEAEHGNVQAALDWLLAAGQVETAVRLGTALWWFWWVRGHFGEMRWRMEQAVDRRATLPKQHRANLLVASGVLISLDGDHDRAVKLFEEAVALERERRDKTGIPRALRGFGLLIGDREEYARASALFEEALALDREFGNQQGESADLRAMGKMEMYRGEQARAKELFEEALALDRRRGDRHSVAFSLAALGDAARYAAEAPRAERMYEEALAIFRELGSKPGVAYSLLDLAEAARLQAQNEVAASRYGEALELLIHLGNKPRIADCIAGLAALAVTRGQPRLAARLYAVVETMRELTGSALAPPERAEYETHRAAALAALGEEEFERAFHIGSELGHEQGIELARQSLTGPVEPSPP